MQYPERLIEVDLPIKRISAHARREKSIRHGHISTLHIWWARRPLAACRAVLCAALWPDPVDLTGWAGRGDEVRAGNTVVRPRRFLDTARACMTAWAVDHAGKASAESYPNLIAVQKKPEALADPELLRRALLDFIADFANWDNSTDRDYLATARTLTQAAHEALGGEPGTLPLVGDPFAGGGSIPLEALRVGADVLASDLNPVAVLINKVLAEFVPRYGHALADSVRLWGSRITAEAERNLAKYYPSDAQGRQPLTYLWARTIRCEGPGCGTEIPLLRSLWLAKRQGDSVALCIRPIGAEHRIEFGILRNAKASLVEPGTIRLGAVTCPVCGYTTPKLGVRQQLAQRRGGSMDARLVAVIVRSPGQQGRHYRLPTFQDLQSIQDASEALKQQYADGRLTLPMAPIPQERVWKNNPIRVHLYGMKDWASLFTPREALMLGTLSNSLESIFRSLDDQDNSDFAKAVKTCLAFALSRQADYSSTLCDGMFFEKS